MKNILVIDVGGTNVKILGGGQEEVRKIPSGIEMTAQDMVAKVKAAAADWTYDAVSIGYPGPVINGQPALEPKNLARGWVSFDYQAGFGRPVKMLNDAAMQALGSYEGGRMLFLGLGTGLGSAMILDHVVIGLELCGMSYSPHHDFEDMLGRDGRKRLGQRRWEEALDHIVKTLQD